MLILWNQAKIVIGPHGDQLVNLIFSNPKTKVIEIIHTEGDVYGHYYWIANAMNLEYWVLPIKNATMQSNYQVPIQKLLNMLKKMIL